MQKISYTKGYALAVSLIVVTIMLGVGLAVSSLAVREFNLVTTLRESQRAFSAADTGMECALRWDFNDESSGGSPFATSTASNPPTSGINCLGVDIAALWTITDDTDSATTQFTLQLPSPSQACASVTVTKIRSGVGQPFDTTVESRGQNDCTPGSVRRVERALRATY